jgi:hypothetical protein
VGVLIDVARYILAAIVGAGVLCLLASAGVVEIPRKARRKQITAENLRASHTPAGQIIPDAKLAQIRAKWPKRDEANVLPGVPL